MNPASDDEYEPPHGLSDEQLIAVGEIVVAAGHLEEAVHLLAVTLVGGEDASIADVIMTGMPFEQCLAMATRLLTARRPGGLALIQRLDEASQASKTAMRLRNDILHGSVKGLGVAPGARPPASSIYVIRKRSGAVLRLTPSAEEMKVAGAQLRRASMQILRVLSSFLTAKDEGRQP